MNFTDARWNSTISDKLRTLIKASGKTQREIAKDLNYSESQFTICFTAKDLRSAT